jgi:hypothetical protein
MQFLHFKMRAAAIAIRELEVHRPSTKFDLSIDTDVVRAAVIQRDAVEQELGRVLRLVLRVPVIPEKTPTALLLNEQTN